MNGILKWPLIRDLHRRSLLFPAIVILAVAAILLQGALHREPQPEQPEAPEFLSTPAPVGLPALRPDIDKAPLSYASDFWSQLGAQARPRMVLAGPRRVTAITIAPGYAFTSLRVAFDIRERKRIRDAVQAHKPAGPARAGASSPAAPGGREGGVSGQDPSSGQTEAESDQLAGVDLDLGLALIAMKQPYPARPFPFAEGATRPGGWIAAVNLSAEGQVEVTPGHLAGNPSSSVAAATQRELDAAIPFPDKAEISAVIDLDGGLLGIAVADGERPRVFALDLILASLERLRSNQPCRAISTVGVSDRAAELLRIQYGALVTALRNESFPAGTSLQAGDVLLEFNGERVYGAEQFELLYDAAVRGQSVPFVALRAKRRVSGRLSLPDADCLPVAPPPSSFPALGLFLDWSGLAEGAPHWKVAAVTAVSPAGRAGVLEGDWITAVNSEALSERTRSREFDSFQTRPRPMLLTIERAGQIRLIALEPGQPRS